MNAENTSLFRQNLMGYAERKEGVASMMEHLVGVVYEDPDLDPEKLFSLADEYIELIGMDDEQIGLTNYTIGRYISRRQRMKEVREAYPCDNQLFKAVCGIEPQGKVIIDLRPITFNFVCHDLHDYALLTNREMQSNNFSMNRSLLREASGTGGMFLGYELFNDPNLEGSIIVENVDLESEAEMISYRTHEEQHALNYFFQSSYANYLENGYQSLEDGSLIVPLYLHKLANAIPIDDLPDSLVKCKKDLPTQELLLTRMLRKERQEGENDSREEILAYLRIGSINIDDSSDIFRLFKKNKRYNCFPGEWRQKVAKDCVESFKKHTGVKRENMVKRVIEKVFVTEYDQLLVDSMEAICYLRDAGFTFDRTMFLLMSEPLRDWKKMAERMYAARYIQSLDQEENQLQPEVDKAS
ncbi:MAG: hypothetical protein WCV81_05910 [Microgenomates group bacterium]|jgi:hypothetical protein